jgi:hypothetical protein
MRDEDEHIEENKKCRMDRRLLPGTVEAETSSGGNLVFSFFHFHFFFSCVCRDGNTPPSD